jgi:uncharacterized membrane protein HdeD (DUF308 family)
MTNIFSQIADAIKNWWLFLVAGVLLIILSFWVLTTPVESYVGLAVLLSILILANGISYTIFAISNSKQLEGWGWYLVGGIFDIVIGIILIIYPAISIALLPLFVGFWLIFRGISVIGTSLDLKKYGVLDWGWLMLFGIFITTMAFFMILDPLFGFFNIIYLTFLSLLVYGVANIMLAFKLKKIKSKTFDVVDDLKKNMKNKAEDLKLDVLKYINDHPADDIKEAISKKFTEYKAQIESDNK